MIDIAHREITISRQCELLELPRVSTATKKGGKIS